MAVHLFSGRWCARLRVVGLAAVLAASPLGERLQAGLPAIDAYNIGRYHASSGNYEAAVKSFNDALSMNPRYGVVYLARGKAQVRLGHYTLALEDLDTAVKMMPGYADVYLARAQAHAGLRNVADALADCDRAISLDKSTAQAFYTRSQVFAGIGQIAAAQADLQQALRLDPFIEDRRPAIRETTASSAEQRLTEAELPPLPTPPPDVDEPAVLPTALARPDTRLALVAGPKPTTVRPVGPALLPQVLSRAVDQNKQVHDTQPEPQPEHDPAVPVTVTDTFLPDRAAAALEPPRVDVQPIEAHPAERPSANSHCPESVAIPELTIELPEVELPTAALPAASAPRVLPHAQPNVAEPAPLVAPPQSPADQCLERARKFAAAGDMGSACAELTVVLVLEPHRAEARALRGQAYFRAGRYHSAIEDFTALIEHDPSALEAYCDRAKTYLATDYAENALDDAEAALRIDPDCVTAQMAKAEAEKCLQESAARHGAVNIQKIARGLKPAKESAQADRAPAAKPDPARDYCQRGVDDLIAEQYSRAIAHFGVALRLRPGYPEALAGRGKALARMGRWREALADLEAAIEGYPGAADLYRVRAGVYMARHAWSNAQDDLFIAEKFDPESPETRQMQAELARLAPELAGHDETPPEMQTPPAAKPARDANDHSDARRDAQATHAPARLPAASSAEQRALTAQPPHAVAGDAAFVPGYIDTAEPPPQNASANIAAGGSPLSADRAETTDEPQKPGIAEPEPADQPTPLSAQDYFERAEMHAEQANLRDAVADYTAAIELDPTMADAYVGRGYCALIRGMPEQAAPDFEAALELKPHHPRAYFGLGKAYRLCGYPEEAAQFLSEALRLDPSNLAARAELRKAQRSLETMAAEAR
ncbi:MAG TPA: tetratricopeptide repeat protein [Pirellulales bacterium]|nr:tetratricopeptide repeat protein [Pirellulales bacterium]